MEVKHWLDPMVLTWARQWRAVNFGDGDLPSIAGRIKTEAAGAGQGELRQHFPEVYAGDGLLVARALHGSPYMVHVIVGVHFLVRDVKFSKRALAVGLAENDYWRELHAARIWLAATISGLDERKRWPERRAPDCW